MFGSFILLLFTGISVAYVLGGIGVIFTFIAVYADEHWDAMTGLDFTTLGLIVNRLYWYHRRISGVTCRDGITGNDETRLFKNPGIRHYCQCRHTGYPDPAKHYAGDLFMAAVFPGLMLGLLYIIYIIAVGLFKPSAAPIPDDAKPVTLQTILKVCRSVILV